MDEQVTTFDCWCICELFGHTRLAGRVTEQAIAGSGLIRIDVPELPATKYNPAQPGFTRYVGVSAVYSLTPVSQEIAMRAAESMRVAPVNVYMAMPQLESGPKWGEEDEDDERNFDDSDDPDDDAIPGDPDNDDEDGEEMPF